MFELIDRAVWVVTAAAGGARSGLLATWVMQSSLDPSVPKVTLSLNRQNFTTELIEKSGGFGLHLLRPDQTDLAWGFGLRSGRDNDKFDGLKTTMGVTGAPLLIDCLGWMECRVLRKIEIGDRLYIWSRVVANDSLSRSGEPLRERALLASASEDQRAVLLSRLKRDAERERLAWQTICSESATEPDEG
ncbi:MAG TPA: flavin reductase family protein [Pirellulales bacterium]|jgi:flavin reductase (DIM6/NTAB) family NADH-FMN oxidoreductase RutF|nr:flavin reductase family protein [Pirellulales bacterium]